MYNDLESKNISLFPQIYFEFFIYKTAKTVETIIT